MASHRITAVRDQHESYLQNPRTGHITRRGFFLCDALTDLPTEGVQAGDIAFVAEDGSIWSCTSDLPNIVWSESALAAGEATPSFDGSHGTLTGVGDNDHHDLIHNHLSNSEGSKISLDAVSDWGVVSPDDGSLAKWSNATQKWVEQTPDALLTPYSYAPVGVCLPYAGSTVPGVLWMFCDGTSLVRSTYPDLFAVIGTTYGAADGTHFNLPDMRQRYPLGKAASGTGASLGDTGGTIDHTHDAHSAHSASSDHGTHSSGGGHTHDGHGTVLGSHNIASNTTTGGGADRATNGGHAGTHSSDGGHTHDAHSAHTASSAHGTHSAVNAPYLALNYIIRIG